MPRLLGQLLLSLALIFQGMGSACMAGVMPPDMAGQVAAQGDVLSCMDSQACPNCPGDHMTTRDCMQDCSLPAGMASAAHFMPRAALRDNNRPPPRVSLVDHHQVPPTPPPIA